MLSQHIARLGLGRDDLLFGSPQGPAGNPLSCNTFRTRYWLPALESAELGRHVRMHDLRHAHASWLLAGGADLKTVMDRLGHSQIQTTQKYLHTLLDAHAQALKALSPSKSSASASREVGRRRGGRGRCRAPRAPSPTPGLDVTGAPPHPTLVLPLWPSGPFAQEVPVRTG